MSVMIMGYFCEELLFGINPMYTASDVFESRILRIDENNERDEKNLAKRRNI